MRIITTTRYIPVSYTHLLGLESTDLKLLTALVVAVFLAIPYWKGKYIPAKVKTGAQNGGNRNA